MSNPLLVGIDVHRKTNTACLIDCQGQRAGPSFTVPNNLPGTETLAQKLTHQAQAGNHDRILVAAEATGLYWWHLFCTLSRDPFLNQWPLELYPLNPRATANFKKTFSNQDKTDPIDALVVADRLRLGRDLPAPFACHEPLLALRLLTRYRFHLIHALVQEKSYFLAYLYLKASEYTHLKPFTTTFGAASRAAIKQFASLEDIAAIPLQELTEFIDAKGKRRFADPQANARRLKQVAQDSYPLAPGLEEPLNLILDQSLQHIAFLERRIKRLDVAIDERLQHIPHTLDTIPGIGPVFSAGIMAEIGDLSRFQCDEAKVAKFAGLTWRQTQSGDFRAQETRISRCGNRYLRYYLCEAANSVRLCDPEYAAYYQRKHDEVPKHQHKRAIVLTARKLVRLVVRLLTTNQPYRPRRT